MTVPGEPIDVAYVELRSDGSKLKGDIKKDVDAAFKDVDKSSKQLTNGISDDFDKVGAKISNTFRDVKGRLRDVDTGRFVKDGIQGFEALGQAASAAGAQATSSFTDLFSNLSEIAGPLKIAIAAFVVFSAVGAAASIAVQGLVVAAAGLAALPGLILGAVGAFGILKVATSGIAAAFKELTTAQKKAGGGQSAKQLESSQRGVADALRGVTQAQKDLNNARTEAVRDIERLTVAIEKARATELRSANNLVKAEKLLEDTRKVGTTEQITEATIAYEEAKAAADDAAQSSKELAQDKAKSDRVGVEGSDKVVAALERLRDAQDRVVQSQAALAAGGAALGSQTPAFDKLTKSAKSFVQSLVDGKAALDPLADRIQETFFQGTDKLIPDITKNINGLQGPILELTGTLNGLFSGLLKFLGSPEFQDAAAGALKGFSGFLKEAGPGFGRLLKAFTGLAGQFGKVGKDGKTLGESLGEALGGLAEKLGAFLDKVDLAQLFEDAKNALAQLKPLLGPTVDLVKELFVHFKNEGPTIIRILSASIAVLSASIEFSNFVFQTLLDLTNKGIAAFQNLKKELSQFALTAQQKFSDISAHVKELPNQLAALGGRFFSAGKKLLTSLFEGLGAAGGFALEFGKKLTNGFIQAINNSVIAGLNNGIKKIQSSLNLIPGVNLSLFQFDKIPGLESGGVTTRETLARIGEKGRKEGVIPLENPRAMAAIGNAIAKASGDGNGGGGIVFAAGAISVSFNGAQPSEADAYRAGQALGSGIASILNRQNTRTRVRTLGPSHG